MATRFIDEREATRTVAKATARYFPQEEHDGAAAKVTEAVGRWLERQRTAPDLVGATVAADILGVKTPHLARFREQGRMPEPIPVEGSFGVYIREEVEALAAELAREREERARKRAERSTE